MRSKTQEFDPALPNHCGRRPSLLHLFPQHKVVGRNGTNRMNSAEQKIEGDYQASIALEISSQAIARG
jgi:hypothetical protein